MSKFNVKDFGKRLKFTLKVDFRKTFVTSLVYIMFAISFILPVLILVMTTKLGGSDATASAEQTATFTNVWQSIGSASGSAMGMDLTSMCNINMLYFLIVVFVAIFISDDFKSGFAKNLFAVRSNKVDYVISKTVTTFVASAGMILLYFVGAIIGGAIVGLSFDTTGFGAGGIVCCLISKIFLSLVFVSIATLVSVFAKQRLWLSVLCSLAVGMLLFTMVPIITPLNANIINVVMCVVGGGLFAVGFGALSNLVLVKTNLV